MKNLICIPERQGTVDKLGWKALSSVYLRQGTWEFSGKQQIEMLIWVTNDSLLRWEKQSCLRTTKEQHVLAMLEPRSIWLSSLNWALSCNLRTGELRITIPGEFLQTRMHLVSWFFFLSFFNPNGKFYFPSPFKFSVSSFAFSFGQNKELQGTKLKWTFFFFCLQKNNNREGERNGKKIIKSIWIWFQFQ